MIRQELLRSARYKTLTSFIKVVMDKTKNPLAIIKGYLDLLPKKFKDEQFIDDFVKISNQEVDKINEWLNHLDKYSKPRPLSLKKVCVSDLIDEALDILEDEIKKAQITVYKCYSYKDLIANLDTDQIQQALLAVLKNSIESMSQGPVPGAQIWVGIENKPDDQFELFVRDVGAGMTPQVAGRIFDPFYRYKKESQGFGLSFAQSIIENHCGQIFIESEPGVGTEISFFLPVNLVL